MGAIPRGRPRKFNLLNGKGKKPPSQAGLYRFVDRETGKPSYIGETGKLDRRFQEHLRNGKFDSNVHDFWWSPADDRSTTPERRKAEKEWIRRHVPEQNKNGGGGGRIARQPLVDPPIESVPFNEAVPEPDPESMPGPESVWKRMGRSFTEHLREAAGNFANDLKNRLVSKAKENFNSWADNQKDRLVESVKRKLGRKP